nr:hypothetical protein [Sinorhizobium fredii]
MVSIGVVNQLETVQVGEDQGTRAVSAGGFQNRRQAIDKAAAIVEPRKSVKLRARSGLVDDLLDHHPEHRNAGRHDQHRSERLRNQRERACEVVRRRRARSGGNSGVDLRQVVDRGQNQEATQNPIRGGPTLGPQDRRCRPGLDDEERQLVEEGVLERPARQVIDQQIEDNRTEEEDCKDGESRRHSIEEPEPDTKQDEAGQNASKCPDGKELGHGRERQHGFENGRERGDGKGGGAPDRRAPYPAFCRNDEKGHHEYLGNDEIHRQQGNRTTHRQNPKLPDTDQRSAKSRPTDFRAM